MLLRSFFNYTKSLAVALAIFAASRSYGLDVVWTASQPSEHLKTFSAEEISHLKKLSSLETDPATGKSARWEGVSLSEIVDETLKDFPNERKAQIDLVVLKNASGGEALIPRSFIVKYPVLLASKKDHRALSGLASVPPWTSKSKSRSEGLAVESYFLNEVTEIDLGNYRQRYGTVFLKNRMEPTALRGEKTFIQNCLSCHDGAKGESGIAEARKPFTNHPDIKGAPKLDDRERRALKAYLDIYGVENPPKTATSK
jgi:hypothetical protein